MGKYTESVLKNVSRYVKTFILLFVMIAPTKIFWRKWQILISEFL